MQRLESRKVTPEVLKKAREFLMIDSAKAMADLLGVSHNTYLNWESGRNPVPLIVERLLGALAKNLTLVESLAATRYYTVQALRTFKAENRVKEFYPRFDLDHAMSFPVMEFLLETLSELPFDKVGKRLNDFLEEQKLPGAKLSEALDSSIVKGQG